MNNNNYLCIVGLKMENSNQFYAIYQNKVYNYEQAKKILRKVNKIEQGFKIYKISQLDEI